MAMKITPSRAMATIRPGIHRLKDGRATLM
jgi:hypothetical protein